MFALMTRKLQSVVFVAFFMGCAQPERITVYEAAPDKANADTAGRGTSPTSSGGKGAVGGMDGEMDPEQDAGGKSEGTAVSPSVEAEAAQVPSEEEMSPRAPKDMAAGGAGGAAATAAGGAKAPLDTNPTAAIVGNWAGTVQDLLNRDIQLCFTVTPVGKDGECGGGDYKGGITCRSRLMYTETNSNVYSFRESMVSGACGPGGLTNLTLNPDGTMLYSFYVNQGSIPEGQGQLKRQAESCF